MRYKKNDENLSDGMKALPVLRFTLDEYHKMVDGHPSKKTQRFFEKISKTTGSTQCRLEITDLMNRQPIVTDLYFMVHGEYIKIGQSVDPCKRLLKFQTGAPEFLKIVAVFPGLGSREPELHKRFHHLHHRGEWFVYTDEIDSLIKELEKETK